MVDDSDESDGTGGSGSSDGSGGPKDSPDLKQTASLVSVVATIISILIGIQSLTGVNVLKKFLHALASSAPVPVASTPAPIPTASAVVPTTLAPVPTFSFYDPPAFIVQSSNWSGPCNSGCTMSAIFLNVGGKGSGTATFHVYSAYGADLADCSVLLPNTASGAETSEECTAYDVSLQQYFNSNPGSTVTFRITIDNTYSP